MPEYAKTTDVPADRSQGEIERVLTRYGASEFYRGWDETTALLAFKLRGVPFQFRIPMPAKDDRSLTHTDLNKRRAESAIRSSYEQAVRQRWRAMLLFVKAALEAVDLGLMTPERALLSAMVLPSGRTVGDWAMPQIERAIEAGKMPPLLGFSSEDTSDE